MVRTSKTTCPMKKPSKYGAAEAVKDMLVFNVDAWPTNIEELRTILRTRELNAGQIGSTSRS